MISFFLYVSFPRNRWQANCVFRSIATRKRNETLRLWPGSAEPCKAIGASLRTQVRTSWQNKNTPAVTLEQRAIRGDGKRIVFLGAERR